VTAAAGLDMAGIDGQLAAAARAAARAVRIGRAGARVRMPTLGSVQHGTPPAALKGCPCLRCDRLRGRLLAAPAAPAVALVAQDAPERDTGRVPAAATSGGRAGWSRSTARATRPAEVDRVAVERVCAGEPPSGRLTVAERTAAVSRLTGSGLSARQVSARIGVSTRTVVRARRRARGHELQTPEAAAELLGWAGGGSEAWRDEALCRQVDPELFFPDTGGSVREAKRVCAGCPVRKQCLDWAIAHDQRYGVWGGLTVNERTRLRRQRDRTERAG
jgi:WhiB family redox-sensing transcriptional regulator